MARSKDKTDFSASILSMSDEVFDVFCQPCSSTQNLKAAGYCQECSEYLCKACVDYHGKLASLKNHTVLDKSEMKKSKTKSIKRPQHTQSTGVLTEKCRKHPDKVLEIFCKTHDQIYCSVCVSLDHNSCLSKSYVSDISGGVKKIKEYKSMVTEINRLTREITKRQDRTNDASKTNTKDKSKALANIKVFRKQMNELLDKIEEDAERKLTDLHQENMRAISNEAEKLQSLLSEVTSMAVNMEKSANAGNNNQLFVQVKVFSHRTAEIEKQIKETSQYKVSRYSFNQDEKVKHMKSTLSALWSLFVRNDDTPTKARYVREIHVKTENDTEECCINSIAVLSGDRVLATDYDNNAVKMFDSKANQLLSRLPLSSKPFDITEISPDQVAVASGDEEKIVMITVSDVLSTSQSIQTAGAGVVGLRYDGSNFITVCQNPGSVKIIDMSGKTLKTISTDINGEQLFTTPRYIALSRDKNVVYTTDQDANKVTSMTLSGHIISVYKHSKLKRPAGVAVGKDGTVYVCSEDNSTVHQLTPAGNITRVILGRERGLAVGPVAIAYDEDDDRLYISSKSAGPEIRNYTRQYQLE